MSNRNKNDQVPESERWLHQPDNAARLDRALAAIDQPPTEADLDALEELLRTSPLFRTVCTE